MAPAAPPTPAALRLRRRVAIAIVAGVVAGGAALAIMVNDEADDAVTREAADDAPSPAGAKQSVRAGAKDEGTPPRAGASHVAAAGVLPGAAMAATGGGEPGATEPQPGVATGGADAGAPVEAAGTASAPAGGKAASPSRKVDGGVAVATVVPAGKAAAASRAQEISVPGAPGGAAPNDGGVRASDAGVPDARPRRGSSKASQASSEGGGHGAGGATQSGRSWVNERSRVDEEDSLTRLDRFVAGGATLSGRIVAAETGKAIEGATIHAHSGGAYVEAYSDASGGFRVEGMPARSHAIIWVDRPGGAFIDERLEVAIGAEGQTSDAGTIRLLRGDELRAHSRGWVGLFVSRRGAQIVAGAVSAWLPADKAEIQVGDEILSIDGQDTAGLGPRAATFLLRGAVGTPTTIVVRAHGGAKRSVKLERVPR
jgi:hypothetical protein